MACCFASSSAHRMFSEWPEIECPIKAMVIGGGGEDGSVGTESLHRQSGLVEGETTYLIGGDVLCVRSHCHRSFLPAIPCQLRAEPVHRFLRLPRYP